MSYFCISFQIFSLSEDAEILDDKKDQKKVKKSNKSKANQRKNSKKSNEKNLHQTSNIFSAKIFATIEKYKEVFFIIRSHSAQSTVSLAVSCFYILQIFLFLPLKT